MITLFIAQCVSLCKGPFTPSKSESENEKNIKKTNIKETFCFRFCIPSLWIGLCGGSNWDRNHPGTDTCLNVFTFPVLLREDPGWTFVIKILASQRFGCPDIQDRFLSRRYGYVDIRKWGTFVSMFLRFSKNVSCWNLRKQSANHMWSSQSERLVGFN